MMKSSLFSSACLMALCCFADLAEAQSSEAPDYKLAHELNDRLGQAQAYRYRLFHAVPMTQKHQFTHDGVFSDVCQQPFGIHVSRGDALECHVDHAPKDVVFVIYNPAAQVRQLIPLRAGKNTLTASLSGLCYFYYPTEEHLAQKPVQVYLKGGKINGIYNQGDGERAWAFIQKMPSNEYMEILSGQLNLVLPKELLKEMDADAADALISEYGAVYREVLQLLGQSSYSASSPLCLSLFPEKVTSRSTIPHVASTDFLFKPSSAVNQQYIAQLFAARAASLVPSQQGELAEVLQALVAEFSLLAKDQIPVVSSQIAGYGALASHERSSLIERSLWNASMRESNEESIAQTRAPLHSLCLYFSQIRGDKNFLPRLMERLRLMQKKKLSPSEWRCNFLMALCDASKRDLTRFFLTTGMLAPMNRPLNQPDYEATTTIVITMEDVKKVWQHASKYPEDECRVLHLVRQYNVTEMQEKKPLALNSALNLSVEGPALIIPEGYCKNVIAYAIYDQDNRLINIAFANDSQESRLLLPSSPHTVQAVAWNGARVVIHERK